MNRGSRRPVVAIATLTTVSLACSLLSRSAGDLPSTMAAPGASPTASAGERSASGLLQQAAPSTVDGVEVNVVSLTGSDLDPADPAAVELMESYGADPARVEIATGVAANENGPIFQGGVIRVPGRDWTAVLEALATTQDLTPGVSYEWVPMNGRRALRAQSSEDPALPAVFYAPAGDAVLIVQSTNPGAVEESIGALPEDDGQGESNGWEPPVPGTFPLLLQVIERPHGPVCVGERPGRQWLKVIAIDTGYGVPYPYGTYIVSGRLMDTDTQPQYGPMLAQPYRAARYGVDGTEEVLVSAISPMGGQGQTSLSFQVEHCLYGTWQDGDREVRITPPFSASITAEVISGEICGEEGGIDFTGVLEGDRLTGDDLKVCNPDECVDAGILPASITVPFTGKVADDGMSVVIDWTGDFYQFEEDAQGNVVSCPATSTEEHQFTITRLSFGE